MLWLTGGGLTILEYIILGLIRRGLSRKQGVQT